MLYVTWRDGSPDIHDDLPGIVRTPASESAPAPRAFCEAFDASAEIEDLTDDAQARGASHNNQGSSHSIEELAPPRTAFDCLEDEVVELTPSEEELLSEDVTNYIAI